MDDIAGTALRSPSTYDDQNFGEEASCTSRYPSRELRPPNYYGH